MAKKPTPSKTTALGNPTAVANPVKETALKPAQKKAVKKTAKSVEPKAVKAPAARTRVKTAVVTNTTVSITPADIALRAYFIAEKRHKLGLPGDSTSDWVEAERQLQAEARLKAKK